MNCNYKGISRTKFGKFYAYIKINQKQINLGTYANESDALFARWYAEIILFKEYRFPKEKPITSKESEIKEYIEKRLKRSLF